MESQYARRLRSGKEYDHLFPRPVGKDHEIRRKASVGDTVHFIKEQVPQTLWQTKAVARMLKGRNLHETCRNIWNFVYNHIQYQKDEEGVEQVRSPRRLWWEKKGDCDCYSVFISSVLFNLKIPHKYRITKYPREDPSEIRWQHIYPVVPRNGRLDGKLYRRGDYVVIDCVKDAFDAEQPYLEKQDFECKMRLDYLDGIEEEGMEGAEEQYAIPHNVDAIDLASLYDEQELGKAGWLKKAVKKVGKTIGKGIRFINRVANPATMLLRNGFLLAMKTNFLRLAVKLRFAYLSDAEAQKRGMNMAAFAKLKRVLQQAEKVYHGAGGKKDKLKDAILKGKGNRDRQVPLSGLEGMDNEYADQAEYNIIHTDSVDGLGYLGEPATAATIAAAMTALTAVGAALKSVKGLFPSGSKEGKEFDADTETTAGKAAAAVNTGASLIKSAKGLFKKGKQAVNNASGAGAEVSNAFKKGKGLFKKRKQQQSDVKNPAQNQTDTAREESQVEEDVQETMLPAVLPKTEQSLTQESPENAGEITQPTTASNTPTITEEKKSLFKDPIGWAKENKVKAALGVLAVAGLGYVGFKALSGNKKGGMNGLEGLPPPARRKKRKGNKRKKTAYVKSKLKAIKIQ